MTENKFTLTPVKELPKQENQRTSKYRDIINAFIQGKSEISKIQVEGAKIHSLQNALQRIIKTEFQGKLKVALRKPDLYLVKIKESK